MARMATLKLTILVGATCLIFAVITVSLAVRSPDNLPIRDLARELPMVIDGWQGQDVPLGNQEIVDTTSRLLNYNGYIYRVYRRGNQEVWLYAMYWQQGRISVREVAGHTPDGCWIANGARHCREMRVERFLVGGRLTASAEVRRFEFQNRAQADAIWWHLWGGNIIDRSFEQKTIWPVLRELWIWLGRRGGAQRDQILVRIHTFGDLADVIDSSPVNSFLALFPEVFEAKSL